MISNVSNSWANTWWDSETQSDMQRAYKNNNIKIIDEKDTCYTSSKHADYTQRLTFIAQSVDSIIYYAVWREALCLCQ